MRQGSAPKRGRGRSGGRRGYVNPSNRTYDSNGPDVKVRGTAAHIYDKYQALARDASSSGDRISAENYLQHAEHYFRLMNAHNAQQQQQQNGQNRANGQPVPNPLGGDDAGDEDETAVIAGNGRGAEARGDGGNEPARPARGGDNGAANAAAEENPDSDERSEEALV